MRTRFRPDRHDGVGARSGEHGHNGHGRIQKKGNFGVRVFQILHCDGTEWNVNKMECRRIGGIIVCIQYDSHRGGVSGRRAAGRGGARNLGRACALPPRTRRSNVVER